MPAPQSDKCAIQPHNTRRSGANHLNPSAANKSHVGQAFRRSLRSSNPRHNREGVRSQSLERQAFQRRNAGRVRAADPVASNAILSPGLRFKGQHRSSRWSDNSDVPGQPSRGRSLASLRPARIVSGSVPKASPRRTGAYGLERFPPCFSSGSA